MLSPAPSSSIAIETNAPLCSALKTTVPCGFLPAASRTAGVSIPWSTELRIRWTSGSLSFSITVLSSSVYAPSVTSSISFLRSFERSLTSRLNLEKIVPIGSIRMSIVVSRSSRIRRSPCSASVDSSPF